MSNEAIARADAEAAWAYVGVQPDPDEDTFTAAFLAKDQQLRTQYGSAWLGIGEASAEEREQIDRERVYFKHQRKVAINYRVNKRLIFAPPVHQVTAEISEPVPPGTISSWDDLRVGDFPTEAEIEAAWIARTIHIQKHRTDLELRRSELELVNVSKQSALAYAKYVRGVREVVAGGIRPHLMYPPAGYSGGPATPSLGLSPVRAVPDPASTAKVPGMVAITCPVCDQQGNVPVGTRRAQCGKCTASIVWRNCRRCDASAAVDETRREWLCGLGHENRISAWSRAADAFVEGFRAPVQIIGVFHS
jgi:hypothetical protein